MLLNFDNFKKLKVQNDSDSITVYLFSKCNIKENELQHNINQIRGEIININIFGYGTNIEESYCLPWLDHYTPRIISSSPNSIINMIKNSSEIIQDTTVTLDFVIRTENEEILHAHTSNNDVLHQIALEAGLDKQDYNFVLLGQKKVLVYTNIKTQRYAGFSF
ncbi:MAG: hypothetical protein ACP5N2_01755 [Candidatus Nanoarchaeia archaeon]